MKLYKFILYIIQYNLVNGLTSVFNLILVPNSVILLPLFITPTFPSIESGDLNMLSFAF